MLLLKKFASVFEEEVHSIGLSFHKLEDDILTAENHEKYLRLKAYAENMGGSGRIAIGELLVIKGDVQKALLEHPLKIREDTTTTKKIGNFTLYTTKEVHDQNIAITHLQSLATKIYVCDEYTVIKQKGNHDLIRKNPIFIEFLRGKITIDELFDTIGSLNIPNGLYIQKPVGFGDTKTLQRWKKIGSIVSILTVIVLTIVILLKYLTLYR
ncbi:hypothetical protein ACWGOQ_0008425 [Aquimarina sp. M1]